tara:strand:+ start:56264 stop:56851 length:588 start_codon:yes stop_codon:yes gene_type:complete
MTKGFDTKENILKTAFEFTSKFGLEALSIGELAKSVGMSKSGLFSHFKSKEKLQIKVLDYSANNFTKKIFKPALKEERGIARLDAMMMNWKNWSSSYLPGGCPFLSSIVEFDDRPGPIRDHLQVLQGSMIGTFARAIEIAIEEGQLHKDTDKDQLAYEVYSNMIGFHIFNRLLKDKKSEKKFKDAYKAIIDRYRS